jgi:hypothetical protein
VIVYVVLHWYSSEPYCTHLVGVYTSEAEAQAVMGPNPTKAFECVRREVGTTKYLQPVTGGPNAP